MNKESENIDINSYIEKIKLRNDPKIAIVDNIKSKYTFFQVFSCFIIIAAIGFLFFFFLATLVPFFLLPLFVSFAIFWLLYCITIMSKIEKDYEKLCVTIMGKIDKLSNKKTLEVIEQAEGYKIQEILLKEYKKRGFLYQKQADIALDYIKNRGI